MSRSLPLHLLSLNPASSSGAKLLRVLQMVEYLQHRSRGYASILEGREGREDRMERGGVERGREGQDRDKGGRREESKMEEKCIPYSYAIAGIRTFRQSLIPIKSSQSNTGSCHNKMEH